MQPFNPKLTVDEQAEEGPVGYRIGSSSGKVVVEFDRTVRWVAFPPEEIPNIVSMLRKATARIKHEVRKKKGV